MIHLKLMLSVFAFSLVFSLSNCFSQKFEECYINTKTGDTLLTTLWDNLIYEDDLLLSYQIEKHNSQFFLNLKYNFGKKPPFSISKSDSVWIKFEDGLVITLFSVDSVKSKRGLSSYPANPKGNTVQGVSAKYPISFIYLMMLQTQPIDKFKIFTSRGSDMGVIPRSKKSDIMDEAKNITVTVNYRIVFFTPKIEDGLEHKKENEEVEW